MADRTHQLKSLVIASEAKQSSALFRQSGLPRRSAPRNDESLRVFASSRETNLLFASREAAKTQGHDSLRVDLRT